MARKLVDSLDDLRQRGQKIPVIGALCKASGPRQVRAEQGWCLQTLTTKLGCLPLLALVGSQPGMPVLAVLVWLAAYRKDTSRAIASALMVFYWRGERGSNWAESAPLPAHTWHSYQSLAPRPASRHDRHGGVALSCRHLLLIRRHLASRVRSTMLYRIQMPG